MAKTETRSSKPNKETSTRSSKSGAGETQVSKGIKKAGKLLESPIVRNMVAAGLETAVATRAAKTSSGKGARQDGPAAIVESAVAAVAIQAAQRLAPERTGGSSGAGAIAKGDTGGNEQGATKPKPPKKPARSSGTSPAKPQSTKSGSSTSAGSGTKKASSGTGSRASGTGKTASKGASAKPKSSGSKAAAGSGAGTKKTKS